MKDFEDALDIIFQAPLPKVGSLPKLQKDNSKELELKCMIQSLENAQADLLEIESKAASLSLTCSNLQTSIELLLKEFQNERV